MDRDEMDNSTADTSPGLDVQATNVWDRIIEDMEVTAEEYEEDGWSALQLHPGDVTVTSTATPPGIDVVLSDSEFDTLGTLFHEGVRFSEYDVFRAAGEESELALLVAKDMEREEAVFLPIYYDISELSSLIEGLDRRALMIHLRQLAEEPILLQISEPDLLIATEEQ